MSEHGKVYLCTDRSKMKHMGIHRTKIITHLLEQLAHEVCMSSGASCSIAKARKMVCGYVNDKLINRSPVPATSDSEIKAKRKVSSKQIKKLCAKRTRKISCYEPLIVCAIFTLLSRYSDALKNAIDINIADGGSTSLDDACIIYCLETSYFVVTAIPSDTYLAEEWFYDVADLIKYYRYYCDLLRNKMGTIKVQLATTHGRTCLSNGDLVSTPILKPLAPPIDGIVF